MNAAIYSKNIKLYSLIFYMDQVHPRIHSCCHRWILQEPVHRIKALNPYGKVWFSVKRSVKINGCWNEATTSSQIPYTQLRQVLELPMPAFPIFTDQTESDRCHRSVVGIYILPLGYHISHVTVTPQFTVPHWQWSIRTNSDLVRLQLLLSWRVWHAVHGFLFHSVVQWHQ